MLRVFRHCIAVLLAITLSAQLIEAQALACNSMEMTAGETMDGMPGMALHEETPPSSSGRIAIADDDRGAPSDECNLEASCLNGSAIPNEESARSAANGITGAVASDPSSVTSRTLSPDLPPPRS